MELLLMNRHHDRKENPRCPYCGLPALPNLQPDEYETAAIRTQPGGKKKHGKATAKRPSRVEE